MAQIVPRGKHRAVYLGEGVGVGVGRDPPWPWEISSKTQGRRDIVLSKASQVGLRAKGQCASARLLGQTAFAGWCQDTLPGTRGRVTFTAG